MGWLNKIVNAQKDVVGINDRNISYIYPYNPRRYFEYANDKALCKTVLEENNIPTPQTYIIIENLWDINDAVKQLNTYDSFVIKPANGSGGTGILILTRQAEYKWQTPSGHLYDKDHLTYHIASTLYGIYSIGDSDKALVEYKLTPHTFFNDLYDKGIPDVRIITLNANPVMAMLRVPTNNSGGKANLHQGALGIGINIETGELEEGLYKSNYVKTHPDTGFNFNKLKMPLWEKVIDTACSTAKVFPLNYLGIDIIYDDKLGPLVVEINARPGLQIQNINKQGLKSAIKKSMLNYV